MIIHICILSGRRILIPHIPFEQHKLEAYFRKKQFSRNFAAKHGDSVIIPQKKGHFTDFSKLPGGM